MAIRKNNQIKFGVNLSFTNLQTNQKERININDTYARIIKVSKNIVYMIFERSKTEGCMNIEKIENNRNLILFIDKAKS